MIIKKVKQRFNLPVLNNSSILDKNSAAFSIEKTEKNTTPSFTNRNGREEEFENCPYQNTWQELSNILLEKMDLCLHKKHFTESRISSVSNYSLKLVFNSETSRNFIQTFYHKELESAVKRVYPNVEEIHYLVSSPVERKLPIKLWKAEAV